MRQMSRRVRRRSRAPDDKGAGQRPMSQRKAARPHTQRPLDPRAPYSISTTPACSPTHPASMQRALLLLLLAVAASGEREASGLQTRAAGRSVPLQHLGLPGRG